MKVKEALTILNPSQNTPEALKKAYRQAALKCHPDHGGSTIMMQLVNQAMELLSKSEVTWSGEMGRSAQKDVPLTETLQKAYDSIKYLPGISIELIGSWLWVTGNTKPVKDQLKSNGFKFSRQKIAWYFHAPGYRKRTKAEYDLESIRNMFFKEDLETETFNAIA